MTMRALLLASAVFLPGAAGAATLDEVIDRIPGEATVDAGVARFDEILVETDTGTALISGLTATQDEGEVVLRLEGEVLITKEATADGEEDETVLITAPDGEIRLREMSDLVVDGTASAPEVGISGSQDGAEIAITLTNADGEFRIDAAPGARSAGHLIYGAAEFGVSDEGVETVTRLDDVRGEWTVANPARELGTYDLISEAVADGFRARFALTAGNTAQETQAEGETVFASLLPWTLTGEVGGEAMTIDLSGDGGGVTFGADGPSGYEHGPYRFSAALPVSAGNTAFSMSGDLSGVMLNAAAWAVIDPNAVLPRTPMGAKFAMSGELVEGGVDRLSSDEPLTGSPIRSLSLDEFEVSGLGALITAAGRMSIGESGEPEDGALTARFEGLNRLIDRLIEAGIITEQQAVSARAPLAMFAKSAGEDVSVIEVESVDGAVSLNGQRIR